MDFHTLARGPGWLQAAAAAATLLGAACVDLALPRLGDGGAGADGAAARGDAGAPAPASEARLLAPAPGGTAPTNLAAIVVGFAAPVEAPGGAFALVAEDGARVDLAVRRPVPGDPACGARPEDTCVVLLPLEPLAPATGHRVLLGPGVLLDGRPLEVDPAALAFVTGAGRDDEPPAGAARAVSSDGCVVVRATASEPVWATLVLAPEDGGDERVAAGEGLAVAHELAASLRDDAPGARLGGAVRVVDLGGNATVLPLDEAIVAAPADWAIAEVLANPRGPEPAQEWVELVRLGGAPGSLAGLRIADAAGADALPDVTVPAGGRVLVVPSGYDPAAPGGDVAPAAGALLARLFGSTIGHAGLANAGETVTLLDESGRPISIFTSYFDMSSPAWAGRSVERVRPGGCDVRANAAPNAAHAATPGAPNSVEP